MADLNNIGESAVAGGLGASVVAWVVKMFVKSKIDQIDKNTADILSIKQHMVTKTDLDTTADNLKEEITQGVDRVTQRIDQLFARMK